jgi:uncharacterized protein YidB (DUF937 family)
VDPTGANPSDGSEAGGELAMIGDIVGMEETDGAAPSTGISGLISIPSSVVAAVELSIVGDVVDALESTGTDPSDGSKFVGEFKLVGETVGRTATGATASGKIVVGMLG